MVGDLLETIETVIDRIEGDVDLHIDLLLPVGRARCPGSESRLIRRWQHVVELTEGIFPLQFVDHQERWRILVEGIVGEPCGGAEEKTEEKNQCRNARCDEPHGETFR